MFKNLNDIHQAIDDFRRKTGKYPNVIFIPYSDQSQLYSSIASYNDEFHYSTSMNIVKNGLILFGIQVKWTQGACGVDYLEEFENIVQQQQKFAQQQYEYFNKVLKPLTTKIKPKKRKIILWKVIFIFKENWMDH